MMATDQSLEAITAIDERYYIFCPEATDQSLEAITAIDEVMRRLGFGALGESGQPVVDGGNARSARGVCSETRSIGVSRTREADDSIDLVGDASVAALERTKLAGLDPGKSVSNLRMMNCVACSMATTSNEDGDDVQGLGRGSG
ncbi:hypothetical protein AXG93_523s1050 [Marchantia polymorpha subsp. ruderalis]|uniref:Uncharacterized protein n=1 Tax=Marchantia polymorpha subsp. ruderalis TaxID=1480154 RepID=A0A176VXC9_MARPO|nr:hypothetical protein AXG93_523s1050 [Marchantia polymorpha subsp. ruderalis]